MAKRKRCGHCSKTKDESKFSRNPTKNSGKNSWCKACQIAYDREYYQENKERYRAHRVRQKREIFEYLWELKKEKGCARCPEGHPACLDFHHRDPDEKEIPISSMVSRGWSMRRVKAEVKKCDVLCSNCHRKHHWECGQAGKAPGF